MRYNKEIKLSFQVLKVSYKPSSSTIFCLIIYIQRFFSSALDQNECDEDSNLCPNGTCHNDVGSYYCECNIGFLVNGKTCERMCSTLFLIFCTPTFLFITIFSVFYSANFPVNYVSVDTKYWKGLK